MNAQRENSVVSNLWKEVRVRCCAAPEDCLDAERVAYAQDSTKFRSGHAGVGGQAVVVIEARFRRPGREIGATKIGEALLETGDDLSCTRVARGNGTTSARIAAFEIHFANAESDGAAFFFAKEMVFPKRRYVIDFRRGAEALARFVDVHAIKQFAYSVQSGRGNDGRAVGDVVVGETFGRIANGDGLLEKSGKPLGGRGGIARENERLGGDFAAV